MSASKENKKRSTTSKHTKKSTSDTSTKKASDPRPRKILAPIRGDMTDEELKELSKQMAADIIKMMDENKKK